MAAKRWVEHQADQFKPYRVTLLGDDLYCNQPLCQLILDKKLRDELGAWGLRKSKQYDCEKIIPEITDIYKETLNFK